MYCMRPVYRLTSKRVDLQLCRLNNPGKRAGLGFASGCRAACSSFCRLSSCSADAAPNQLRNVWHAPSAQQSRMVARAGEAGEGRQAGWPQDLVLSSLLRCEAVQGLFVGDAVSSDNNHANVNPSSYYCSWSPTSSRDSTPALHGWRIDRHRDGAAAGTTERRGGLEYRPKAAVIGSADQ